MHMDGIYRNPERLVLTQRNVYSPFNVFKYEICTGRDM